MSHNVMLAVTAAYAVYVAQQTWKFVSDNLILCPSPDSSIAGSHSLKTSLLAFLEIK